jgi:hypothetical protein
MPLVHSVQESTLLPPVPGIINFFGLALCAVSRGLDTTSRIDKVTIGLLQLLTWPRTQGPTTLVNDNGRRLHV